MAPKRILYESNHPVNKYPFEILCSGSWHAVEFIRIKNGAMTIHMADDQCVIESRSFANLRVRSRPATISDCTCFLRPGIDICFQSSLQHIEGSDEERKEPVWVDAKISSIKRKPHESECSCQFFIKSYIHQGLLGEKVVLSKETEEVQLHQISILQRLEKSPCGDQYYRWGSSDDCSTLYRTKLCLGKFCSDISWLLVTSVLKQISFDVRSANNKIVYQILSLDGKSPLEFNSLLHALNFGVNSDLSESNVFQFDPVQTYDAGANCSTNENVDVPYSVLNLRRSKRRNVQPDRFLGCEHISDSEIGSIRLLPYKTYSCNDEDMSMPLSSLFGMDGNESYSEMSSPEETGDLDWEDEIKPNVSGATPSNPKATNGELKKHQNKLAVVPTSLKSQPVDDEELNYPKFPGTNSEDNQLQMKFSFGGGRSLPKKLKDPELDDYDSTWNNKFNSKPPVSSQKKKVEKRNYFYCSRSKINFNDEPSSYRKNTLSAGAYNKVINSYMKKIDSTMGKEEPNIIDQWNQFKAKTSSEKGTRMDKTPVLEDDEPSELDLLWREMELCLASSFFEENEVRVSESQKKASEGCKHEFTLSEEIGVICHVCGYVRSEIKHVSAPFMERKRYTSDGKPWNEEEEQDEHMPDADEGLDLSSNKAASEKGAPLAEEGNNVWALIPDLKMKLHLHQKRAFEFLWRNIAGSLVPSLMESASESTGGCVVSHSPGAGKTFLMIAFLQSYLKLFPGKRPLVLAPKTTLYTWYKEFIKWEIPIPVHLIHGRRTYRVFSEQARKFRGVPRPSNDVMHVLDCLEKIQKWHAQPGVLVMGYTSFLTLMREDSKFEHRRYMAKVLRESPGLLVLDEGHNPRSTKSRLRKCLMKVETDLRVLLSGTLFQNNFCEYFNTLCLARPKFVTEVLSELDPKFRKKKNPGKARNLLENRARKFFLDHIERKIDSDVGDERKQGLEMLKNMTNGFIDVYEGANSDGLPGLQIYTLLMNSTEVQHEILAKLHKIMAGYSGYPLELELLITLASMHPWLVKTSNCVNKFFNENDLLDLEKLKFDCKKGSKVMFVLNLVYRVVKKEKVLIFCHNIAPINLFVELFERVFRWQKGREIMVLTGDLELFERGRIIDKFEEPCSPSRVLLASITACAEGISLTAASRVIMLDSEWNPSKTKQAIARAFRPGQQKVVFVYQLLATGTLEEDKYRRTTWKEWVSNMIFSEDFVEDPSRWQAEKIEDDVLREMVAEDKVKSFHMIMKNERASTQVDKKKAQIT